MGKKEKEINKDSPVNTCTLYDMYCTASYFIVPYCTVPYCHRSSLSVRPSVEIFISTFSLRNASRRAKNHICSTRTNIYLSESRDKIIQHTNYIDMNILYRKK